MGESSQEKTEEATPKRLRDARKKGDIPKSRDLTTVVVMVVMFVTIAVSAGFITNEIKQLMTEAYKLVSQNSISNSDMWVIGKMSLLVLGKILAPVLAAGVISAFLIGFLQAGGVFSADPLVPKFEKLNPIQGLKNMFKMQTFIELLKNMLKLSVVIYLAYQTISQYLQEILLSSQINIIQTVSMMGAIVYSFFSKVAMVFFVIALFDMAIQRWNYAKKHRMSKDEVKREYKQDEGDPQIKGERRRLHREMVFGDVRKNVKKADAVVSNPVHVAVAIQYDRQEMGAPEVVAKGQQKFAELILQVAREEHVPIIRNIPLAWSLLQIDEGDPIPEDLYEPVAEVLSMVYEMKEKQEPSREEKAVAGTPSKDQKDKKGPVEFKPLG